MQVSLRPIPCPTSPHRDAPVAGGRLREVQPRLPRLLRRVAEAARAARAAAIRLRDDLAAAVGCCTTRRVPAAAADPDDPVHEMFRDPSYWLALRQQVVPLLRTYPSLKVWVAGCSTGEEVFSLAILLQEEGLLERTHDLRHRHQPGGRWRRRARASSRSPRCASTRPTTRPRAASARSPTTTRGLQRGALRPRR
jgi:hypothetical protein